MRVNPRIILEAGRIPATRWDGASGTGSAATVVFVTAELLSRLQQAAPEDPDAIEVAAGSILTAWRNEDGNFCHIYGPSDIISMRNRARQAGMAENAPAAHLYTLRTPGDAQAMAGLGFDRDRIALFADGGSNDMIWSILHGALLGDGRDHLNPNARAALASSCRDVTRAIAQVTRDGGFMLAAQVMDISAAYGSNALPEGFERYIQAKSIRAEIAQLEPRNPAGLGPLSNLNAALHARGLEGGLQHGVTFRLATGQLVSSDMLVAMVRGNDALNRRVFGALTSTRIEDLGATIISPSKYDELVTRLTASGEILTGAWVEEAERRVRAITSNTMEGYAFEMCIASIGGVHDVLMVKEPSAPVSDGRESGAAYLYSWPAADRLLNLAVEGNGRRVPMVSPGEIPSEDELAELRAEFDAVCARVYELEGAPNID